MNTYCLSFFFEEPYAQALSGKNKLQIHGACVDFGMAMGILNVMC